MYFKSLLSSKMQEATSGRVELNWTPSCEIAFRSIVQYFYTGDYDVSQSGNIHTLDHIKQFFHTGLFSNLRQPDSRLSTDPDHAHIYVVADRLMMPELKSLALAKFMVSTSDSPTMGIHSRYIKPLVELLYYDSIDVEHEEGKVEVVKDKSELPTSSDEAGSPTTSTEEESDPRRSMQKEFVKKVHMGIESDQVSAICNDLILEGGQFAQDLFLLVRKAEAEK